MTSNTITDIDKLSLALDETRRCGFATDNEEYTPGLFCVAVPIQGGLDRPVAAMSISVPRLRCSLELLGYGLALLARASFDLSKRLGGPAAGGQLEQQLKDVKAATRALLTQNRNWSWQVRGDGTRMRKGSASVRDEVAR